MKLVKLVTVFTLAAQLSSLWSDCALARHVDKLHNGETNSSCATNPGLTMESADLPGFVVLKMGMGTQAWFNASEVKAFHPAAKGISVACAPTEIIVHDDHYWVQDKPEVVAKKLAEALGLDELAGWVVLTMGNGALGWFNAGEVMAFFSPVKGISVSKVRTELIVHGYRVWLQESPRAVAAKLAQARAKSDSTKP